MAYSLPVWPSVKAVAAALLVREELDRDAVADAIAGADLFTPVLAVQRAHGLLRTAKGVGLAAVPRIAPRVLDGRTR